MFFRVKGKGKYRYLQLVENHREGCRTVQRTLCTLGREEEMRASGSIDVLVRSLARFSQQFGLEETSGARLAKTVSTNTLEPDPIFSPDQQPAHGATSAASAHRFPPKSEAVRPYGSKDSKASLLSHHDRGADILRKSPIFSDLADEQLVELSRLALERRLKRGEFLFFQDETMERWYVVASGMIKAVRHSLSGKDIVAAVYGPGETLGNIVLFVGKPHICSFQAITDTRVLGIKRNDFVSFLHRHPELSFKILVTMLHIGGKRFQDSVVAISELATERTDYRLARTLVTLCLQFGPTIPLARREIAEMAGTATGTAMRFLSRLRQTGVVQSHRGKVTVLQQDKLRLLAQVPVAEIDCSSIT